MDSIVKTLLDGLDGYVAAKTTIGEPIKVEDTILVPLIDVSIGVGAGAALKSQKEAGGMGAKLSPSAVLVIKDGASRIINIKDQTTAMKAMDLVPDIINRISGKTKLGKKAEEEINKLKK